MENDLQSGSVSHVTVLYFLGGITQLPDVGGFTAQTLIPLYTARPYLRSCFITRRQRDLIGMWFIGKVFLACIATKISRHM